MSSAVSAFSPDWLITASYRFGFAKFLLNRRTDAFERVAGVSQHDSVQIEHQCALHVRNLESSN